MLFTIGQVCKMYNISHDTLRYYDKIDLLKPNEKKENGYRYYTIREIELLEIILIAKQLKIPMKDIKNIIEKEDESSYIELFENHKKLLEEKIKNLTKLKHQAQHSIEVTTEMRAFSNNENRELKEEYIDQQIIYFNQIDYRNFGDFMQEKNLIFKVNSINNKIKFDENIIGFKLDKEVIDDSLKYEKNHYKGNYSVLTIKDTIANIEKYIVENIDKLYIGKSQDRTINVFTETFFTLFKKEKSNIYFLKIYIENPK